MDAKIIKAVILRFIRAFVAGSVAAMLAIFSMGITVKSLEDLQALGYALLVGGISGGLQAIDKLLRDLGWYSKKI